MNPFTNIPSVDEVLQSLQPEFAQLNPNYLTSLIRQFSTQVRTTPEKFNLAGSDKEQFKSFFIEQVRQQLSILLHGTIRPVINATGIVLHTNLGRAPLDPEMITQLVKAARYTNLELNLQSGKRGQRNDHLRPLLQLLSGAEDGLAVNNNAAAVMLMLNSVARRKEVILSRGEMVEIGGSFRLPEVMKMSGCKLREVGTTNKTHLSDYAGAIGPKTGAILLCHTSNFKVQGFTDTPALDAIVKLAAEHNIPVLYDLGSGAFELPDFDKRGEEPLVQDIVSAGVDLVSFSGDKLLGGPQAGLIVGREKWVMRCTKNQLLRALRLDKLMFSLLQQTLIRHLSAPVNLDGPQAINQSAEQLRQRCYDFVEQLPTEIQNYVQIIASSGQVGSGAYPLDQLPSYALRISHPKWKASRLARELRQSRPAVIGYIVDDALHLDLRALNEAETGQLGQILCGLF